MAVEAAAVQHGAVADQLHDRALANHRADRKATRKCFGEDRQVGRDAQASLRAAERNAKASNHFVEDEHHAVLVAQRAHTLQIASARHDDAGVTQDGLHDQRGRFPRVRLQIATHRCQVVPGQHGHVAGRDC